MIYANVHAAGHANNSMFAEEDSVHRFNPTYIPRRLREEFLKNGIELNTPDLNTGRTVAFDLFFEGREFVEDGIPKYLIALENPHINLLNTDRNYCGRFRKVFAWDKRLHDLPNVVHHGAEQASLRPIPGLCRARHIQLPDQRQQGFPQTFAERSVS